MQLESRALQWHQYYAKANGGLAAFEWPTYIDEMRKRFGDTKFSDPMSDIVVLKQQGSVEEYYEAFLTLLNSLQLPPAYALSIFISNLKPEISNTVRLFFPKSLSHALTLAKQLELLNQMAPRKTFTPYKTLLKLHQKAMFHTLPISVNPQPYHLYFPLPIFPCCQLHLTHLNP